MRVVRRLGFSHQYGCHQTAFGLNERHFEADDIANGRTLPSHLFTALGKVPCGWSAGEACHQITRLKHPK